MYKNILYNFLVSEGSSVKKDKKKGNSFISIPIPLKQGNDNFPQPYKLKEHHFTVYEPDEEKRTDEFHYTATMFGQDQQLCKLHVYFDINNRAQGFSLFNIDDEKEHKFDEQTRAQFEDIAVSHMVKSILPQKQKMEVKIRELDQKCKDLLAHSESMSPGINDIIKKKQYLQQLRILQDELKSLVKLLDPQDQWVVFNNLLSSIIDNINKEIALAEKQSLQQCSDEDNSSQASNKNTNVSLLDTPVLRPVSPRTSLTTGSLERGLLPSQKKITVDEEDYVNQQLSELKKDSFYPTVLEINEIIDWIKKTQNEYSDKPEYSSFLNKVYLLYLLTCKKGAELFQLFIQRAETINARELKSFYLYVTPSNLEFVLKNNHQALLAFFVGDCKIPIHAWPVSIDGTSYISAMDYLTSPPHNNKKSEMLIILLRNAFSSILNGNLTWLHRCFFSEEQSMKKVREDSKVQDVTIRNKSFCEQLSQLIDSLPPSELSEDDRKKIYLMLQAPNKKSPTVPSLFEQNLLLDENIRNSTNEEYMAVWNGDQITELRSVAGAHALLLYLKIAALPGFLSDSEIEKQVGNLSDAQIDNICHLKNIIQFPVSESFDLPSPQEIRCLRERIHKPIQKLFQLELQYLSGLIPDKMLEKTKERLIYLVSVLKLHLAILAHKENKVKLLEKFSIRTEDTATNIKKEQEMAIAGLNQLITELVKKRFMTLRIIERLLESQPKPSNNQPNKM